MTAKFSTDWSQVTGQDGLDVLRRFLSGDKTATEAMSSIIDTALAGEYDKNYAGEIEREKVHVTTSCHLMALALLNRLQRLDSAHFYKEDPLRYVRTYCLVQRMLGFRRLTLGWPVYGFGAEMLGQTMIYPEDQAPGSDPGVPLLNADNWRDMPVYDPNHQVARVISENLQHMASLTGIQPEAHMPPPYS